MSSSPIAVEVRPGGCFWRCVLLGLRARLEFLFKPRLIFLPGFACTMVLSLQAAIWQTGYYPGWEQSSMPASNIDFTALTHVIHFSVVPNSDGSLNYTANGISTANSSDIISRAHGARVPVLICVGGAGSEGAFQSACAPATLPTLRQPDQFCGHPRL